LKVQRYIVSLSAPQDPVNRLIELTHAVVVLRTRTLEPVHINHSLGEPYKLQASNKITPRRAAVMAYTATLLLRTLPAISQQEEPAKDAEPIEAHFGPWFQEMI
jgi:hypothetical protein